MFKTSAIILRATKYGETSLVVSAFTELFGIQTYMVNGARSVKNKGAKAYLYQPASLVELVVYHNERSTLQRIKEANIKQLCPNIFSRVKKNSIALFMMELLQKLLKQPEPNPDLFYFCEDMLLQLEAANEAVSANIPLFFALQLSHFFGFKIDDNFSGTNFILDLQEGNYVSQRPTHGHFLEGEYASITADILKMLLPAELSQLKINQAIRRELLLKYMLHYALQHNDFGQMKTIPIMQEVLS